MRFATTLSVAVLASSCATSDVPLTVEQVQTATRAQDSSFDAFATLVGPEQLTSTPRGMLADRVTWRVRVHVNKTNNLAVPQLYASVWHQDRNARRYTSASIEGGRQISTTRIDYDPRCNAGGGYVSCTHTETLGVTIPGDAWATALSTGLQIRLNSQAGPSNVLVITSQYARGIANAVTARGASFSDAR